MLVVLDTNVLVSALLNSFGPPARVLDLAHTGELVVAYDDRVLSADRAAALLRQHPVAGVAQHRNGHTVGDEIDGVLPHTLPGRPVVGRRGEPVRHRVGHVVEQGQDRVRHARDGSVDAVRSGMSRHGEDAGGGH